MADVRLIIDPPQRGSWNMAVDQAVLQSANDQGQATIRWYRWSPPTLSLGYFQKLSDRQSHAASHGCDVVRRASGGGAILHDHEWTYSMTLPAKDRWSSQHDTLVAEMHSAMIETLGEFDLQATLHPELSPVDAVRNLSSCAADEEREPTAAGKETFLCFQRRAANDLIVSEYKACGSAQRRIEGAILQHGSLLMRRSDFAPELPGILDLAAEPFDFSFDSRFFGELVKKTALRLSFDLQRGELSKPESVLASKIETLRFANKTWTGKR